MPAPRELLVGLRREQQRAGERKERDGAGEHHRGDDGAIIGGIAEQLAVVLKPDEARREPERILQEERLPHRLARGPVEEDERDDELRDEQPVGQELVAEECALFHGVIRSPSSARPCSRRSPAAGFIALTLGKASANLSLHFVATLLKHGVVTQTNNREATT